MGSMKPVSACAMLFVTLTSCTAASRHNRRASSFPCATHAYTLASAVRAVIEQTLRLVIVPRAMAPYVRLNIRCVSETSSKYWCTPRSRQEYVPYHDGVGVNSVYQSASSISGVIWLTLCILQPTSGD